MTRFLVRCRFVLLVVPLLATGCVSFTGPNMLAGEIAATADVPLEREEGYSVGPLGVFLASTLIGDHLPISPDGLEWVDYGAYAIGRGSSGRQFLLRELELDGWERIVSIREPDEEVAVLIDPSSRTLRRALVLIREDDRLDIIRLEGDIERVLGEAIEFGMLEGGFDDGAWLEEAFDFGDGDECDDEDDSEGG